MFLRYIALIFACLFFCMDAFAAAFQLYELGTPGIGIASVRLVRRS